MRHLPSMDNGWRVIAWVFGIWVLAGIWACHGTAARVEPGESGLSAGTGAGLSAGTGSGLSAGTGSGLSSGTGSGLSAAPDAGLSAGPGEPPRGAPRLVEWRGDGLSQLVLQRAGIDAGGPGMVELRSPVVVVDTPFRELIASWDSDTPAGTWLEIWVSVRTAGSWSHPYSLGVWSTDREITTPRSIAQQRDGWGEVRTDTLVLREPAESYRMTVRLFAEPGSLAPTLRGLTVCTSTPDARGCDRLGSAPRRVLDVPQLSQREYPNGGEAWCSPTSTAMVLHYWAERQSRPNWRCAVPDVAAAVWDSTYGGAGNWSFNSAYASALGDGEIRAFVTRLWCVKQLEHLTAAGFPVVVSASWQGREIAAAPIDQTSGHLLVVVGFDAHGDVVVNDPAGPRDGTVRFVYDRDEFDAAWASAGRTVYLIHPVEVTLPRGGGLGAW